MSRGAAWWHVVDQTLRFNRLIGRGWLRGDSRRFHGKQRESLRIVVPAATKAGGRAFEAYRLLKDREHEESELAAMAAGLAEEVRREEEARRGRRRRWAEHAEADRLLVETARIIEGTTHRVAARWANFGAKVVAMAVRHVDGWLLGLTVDGRKRPAARRRGITQLYPFPASARTAAQTRFGG